MKVKRLLLLVALLLVAMPAAAEARPCADDTAVVVRGVNYIVYTGDGPYEARNLSCAKARRIAKRVIRGERQPGWRCRNVRRSDGSRGRCVRGGVYEDDYGNKLWRYLVAWYPYVPH